MVVNASEVGDTIADRLQPIVGWRVWVVDRGGYLYSPFVNSSSPWREFAPESTLCIRGLCDEHPDHSGRTSLALAGNCGIYALRASRSVQLSDLLVRSAALERHFPGLTAVAGEVYLFGAVVEHEYGWRASLAYPKQIYLPEQLLATTGKLITANYGVPVVSNRPLRKQLVWHERRTSLYTLLLLTVFLFALICIPAFLGGQLLISGFWIVSLVLVSAACALFFSEVSGPYHA